MNLDEATLAHLVAAMLTVNQYPVHRAAALMPGFRERGLLNPARVAAMPQVAVQEAMAEAGYQRGGFLPIVSFRLFALMEAVTAGKLGGLPGLVASGDKAGFTALLGAVPGFGPRTADTAWMLWAD